MIGSSSCKTIRSIFLSTILSLNLSKFSNKQSKEALERLYFCAKESIKEKYSAMKEVEERKPKFKVALK